MARSSQQYRVPVSILVYIPLMVLCAAVVGYAIFYLCTGREGLVHFFTGLNGCFYNSRIWSTDIFTHGIKSDGNLYCSIAIAVATYGLYYCRKKYAQHLQPIVTIDTSYFLPLAVCSAAALGLWWWGNAISSPAFDEVFSGQYAASAHPFQCMAYYMAPNNHILYNLMNNLLCHAVADKVVSGRILSLFLYMSVIGCLFFFFVRFTGIRWVSVVISIALAMQFQVWGFSFQARGYELCLQVEWGGLFSLLAYLADGRMRWLYTHVLCCVAGYACMPSFLYFHGAVLVFMLVYMAVYKKKELDFWKAQLAVVLLAFLFYLPVLSFSGLESVMNNPYVAPNWTYKTRIEFCLKELPNFQMYIIHLFSDVQVAGLHISLLLLFVPLSLLFARRHKPYVLFGIFYLVMWVMYIVIAIAMKRVPFERNLIGHYSITYAGVLLVTWWLTGLIRKQGSIDIGRWVLLPVVLIFFSARFLTTNSSSLSQLYELDINSYYRDTKDAVVNIPKGSTVGFSDGSFYFRYACGKQGIHLQPCPSGNEDYYVKLNYELYPVPGYQLVHTFLIYELYKKL